VVELSIQSHWLASDDCRKIGVLNGENEGDDIEEDDLWVPLEDKVFEESH
jgi:hypothetical protein